jgi:paraquat-inducible protein A
VVALRRGEKAHCTRCDAILASHSWLGKDAATAFTLTGLIIAPASVMLPFVTIGKLGNQHAGVLLSGASGLWEENMKVLSIWVLICGVAAPVALLGVLGGLLLPVKIGWSIEARPLLMRAALALEHWAMPEVYVLAVLVALIKLRGMVDVSIGLGFWCYVLLSLFTLLAWRNFDLGLAAEKADRSLGAKGADA